MITISYVDLFVSFDLLLAIVYMFLALSPMFRIKPEETFYRKHPGGMFLLSLVLLIMSIISLRSGMYSETTSWIGIVCWTLNSILNFSTFMTKIIMSDWNDDDQK